MEPVIDPLAQPLGKATTSVKPQHRSAPAKRRHGIQVAIATHPRAAADLKRELELAKSALLYADHVTICGANTTLLASLEALAHLNDQQKQQFIRQLAPAFMPGREAELELAIRHLSQRQQGGRGFALQLRFRSVLNSAWKDIQTRVTHMLDEAGAAELEPAIRQGLLSVDLLDFHASSGDAVAAYRDKLARYLADPTTYPLFDDDTGSFVRAGREAGIFVVPKGGERRATEAGLASGLIAELPAFPTADMARVLEARGLLEQHVARFRRAVNEFRRYLETTAVDEGFRDEVADLYAIEVQAAMEEIRAELRAPHLTRLMLRAALESAPFPGGLGLVAFEIAHLGAVVSTLLTGATFGASVLNRLASDRLGRETTAARNDLYFLYRANEALKT